MEQVEGGGRLYVFEAIVGGDFPEAAGASCEESSRFWFGCECQAGGRQGYSSGRGGVSRCIIREGSAFPGEGEEGLAVGGNSAGFLEGERETAICG